MSTTAAPSGFRVLVGVASLVVVVAGLKAAAGFFLPVLLGFFLAILAAPLLSALLRRRVPGWLAILLTLIFLLVLVAAFAVFVAGSLDKVSALAPQYQERIQELSLPLLGRLQGWGVDISTTNLEKLLKVDQLFGFLAGALGKAAALLSEGFLVLLITAFLFVEGLSFRRKVARIFGGDAAVMRRLDRISEEVQRYLVIKTAVSALTGFVIGVWLWIMGLDLPVFWGVTAFALNYIPNVGAVISGVPAVLLALVQLGPGPALGVVAAYTVPHFVIGNFLEPAVMGKHLGLSPVVVLLSLLFWGWVWGIVGALLAVPLTMVIKILLENLPGFTWLSALLEQAPASEAP